MEAVVLAAGRGSRLSPLTEEVPKPLLRLGDSSLLTHICGTLKQTGVDRILVVAGYKWRLIQREVEGMRDVEVVVNPNWERGNGSSLLAVEPRLKGEVFVLSMADHLYPAELVSGALEAFQGLPLLVVDRSPRLLDMDDATKVQLGEGETVAKLGKHLDHWDAVDTGVFVLPQWAFKHFNRESGELSGLMGGLIEKGFLKAYDATGLPWIDVDTPQDLELAEEAGIWV